MDMEGPGRIAGLCEERGLTVDIRHIYAGDAVPEQIARDEILIVMGGGMGVGDVEDLRYPFLRREIALIERALADGRAVLGVCLGAQLLAHAAGARVYPHVVLGHDGREVRVREVGWGPVRFLESRRHTEPALAGMAAEQMALHWHGDTFDLPPGAVHLATTPVCPHRPFGWGAGCSACSSTLRRTPKSPDAGQLKTPPSWRPREARAEPRWSWPRPISTRPRQRRVAID